MNKPFNKLSEHYLIPLLLPVMTACLVILVYLINELFKSEYEVVNYYRWNKAQWTQYREQVQLFLAIFGALMVAQFYALKIKKSWFFVFLMLLSSVAFYYFDSSLI